MVCIIPEVSRALLSDVRGREKETDRQTDRDEKRERGGEIER